MFEDISPISELFFYAFILSMFFGIVAKKTDFCPLGGIADIVDTGHTGRFRMYFFAIATAIIGITLLETFGVLDLDGTRPPYRMSQFRWPAYLVGGMFFGVGMTLCRGCGMKNMINLGSCNLKAIVAILGMGSAAVLMLYVEGFFSEIFLSWVIPLTPDLANSGYDNQDIGTLISGLFGSDLATTRTVAGLVIAALILFYVFRSTHFLERKANLIGGLFIGGCIVGAFWLTGSEIGLEAIEHSDFQDQPQNGMGLQSYTFIRPMGDLLYVAANPIAYLITFGLIAFLGVGAGSLLYSTVTMNFNFQWFTSIREAIRYAIGGIMVGIGGILGMGCTLGQGIAGTSTLALGSFLDLAALILGAWIGIKLQRNFMSDHVVPTCDD